MQVIRSLDDYQSKNQAHVACVGNFDGVHLGHQALLKKLKKLSKNQISCVFSFSNHPSQLFTPENPKPLISNISQKVHLLKEIGIDLLILCDFSREFASQSAQEFLQHFHQTVNFHTLLIGFDTHIGSDKKGSLTELEPIANTIGFTIESFPEYCLDDGTSISSTHIRKLIATGDLSEVERLLGRPYAVQGKVTSGQKNGRHLGFPTANLQVKNYSLPPLGVYLISAQIEQKNVFGIANLGVAPTLKQLSSPLLEVHFFDLHTSLYEQEIEVHFHKFIRKEEKFNSSHELIKQLNLDLESAKKLLSEDYKTLYRNV